MKRIAMLGALAASLLTACDLFTGFDTRIRGIVPFTPPADYVEWWEATTACSELAGDFEAIEWHLASWITRNGSIAYGLWRPPHEILIVRGFEDDRFTVRHEMLHDLLSGDPDHASAEWTDCELVTG